MHVLHFDLYVFWNIAPLFSTNRRLSEDQPRTKQRNDGLVMILLTTNDQRLTTEDISV